MSPWTKQRPLTPLRTPLDNSGHPDVVPKMPMLELETKRPEFPSYSQVAIEQTNPGCIPETLDDQTTMQHCLQKQNRQKPTNAYYEGEEHEGKEGRVPQVLPTVPLPILGVMPPAKPPKAKKKNKSLRAIVRFATTSLGKNITSHEVKKSKKKPKKKFVVMPPRPPPKPAEGLVRAHARPLQAAALLHTRETFELYKTRGWLKKPVIHVEFDMPGSLKECYECSSTDFLYVYVGLCNVFLLQFVMVVLLFFTDKEIDLSDLGAYYN